MALVSTRPLLRGLSWYSHETMYTIHPILSGKKKFLVAWQDVILALFVLHPGFLEPFPAGSVLGIRAYNLSNQCSGEFALKFMNRFSQQQYILYTFHVPGSVLGTGNRMGNSQSSGHSHHRIVSGVGEMNVNQIGTLMSV